MLYNHVDYKVSDFPLRISIIFTTQNIMATIAAGISITAAPSSLPDMSSKTGVITSNSLIYVFIRIWVLMLFA